MILDGQRAMKIGVRLQSIFFRQLLLVQRKEKRRIANQEIKMLRRRYYNLSPIALRRDRQTRWYLKKFPSTTPKNPDATLLTQMSTAPQHRYDAAHTCCDLP